VAPLGLDVIKAHAYGNDFLYVVERLAAGRDPGELTRAICHRHTGIGADGLILYQVTAHGAVMRLFNADGGAAEVSGNGVRGLAAILTEHYGLTGEVAIETQAGLKRLTLLESTPGRHRFRAAMGSPEGIERVELSAAGEPVNGIRLWMGNPQYVVLGPSLPDAARFARLGPALERHPAFPQGTNVEFAAVDAPTHVRIVIWERGVGPTLSSGTGSCAAAVAAAAFGGAGRDVTVEAPGGSQRVEWLADAVYLTGWAEIVLEGLWRG
jgi:diaminopimelate epimerase